MKKLVIAALAALTAVSLTACGSKDKKDGSGRVAKMPVQDTVTDAEDVTPTDVEIQLGTAAENNAETSEEDGKTVIKLDDPDAEADSGEEKPDSTSAAEATAGAPFSFRADSSKWNVTSDDKSASLIYNADDITYAKGNCSIMINTRTVDDMPDRTLSEIADAILDSKGMTDNITVNTRGESLLGDHNAYTLHCVYKMDKADFDLDITVMAEGTQVVEVWVMSYTDCTAAMQDNFSQVLDTVSFS